MSTSTLPLISHVLSLVCLCVACKYARSVWSGYNAVVRCLGLGGVKTSTSALVFLRRSRRLIELRSWDTLWIRCARYNIKLQWNYLSCQRVDFSYNYPDNHSRQVVCDYSKCCNASKNLNLVACVRRMVRYHSVWPIQKKIVPGCSFRLSMGSESSGMAWFG